MGQIARPRNFDGTNLTGGIFLLCFDHGSTDVILGELQNLANPALGVFARHVRPKRQQSAFNPLMKSTACAYVQIGLSSIIPQRHAILRAIHIDFKAALFGPPRTRNHKFRIHKRHAFVTEKTNVAHVIPKNT